MFALRAVVVVLGLAMVPLMLRFHGRPGWLFRPWKDPTGQAPWWQKKASEGHWLMRRFPNFWWSAIRNPANGLRTYKWITCDTDVGLISWYSNDRPTNPGPLRRVGRFGWFYAWQGAYSGLWVCIIWSETRHAKFRIGWKLIPDEPIFKHEWGPERAGFASSILPYRKG